MTVKQKSLVEHHIIRSDNSIFLKTHQQTLRSYVDFVYLDPPAVKVNSGAKKPTLRQHETWVNELSERLSLSIPFMKDTAVIAVSVREVEQPRLRLLMDEIYGEENRIGMITIDTANVTNNARLLSAGHEYLLVYAKNLPLLLKSGTKWRKKREGLDVLRKQEKKLRTQYKENYAVITEELKIWLKTQNVSPRLKQFYNADSKGLYTYADLSAPKNGLRYEVINPVTEQVALTPTRGWGMSESNLQELIEQDGIIWPDTDDKQPLRKLYLKDTPDQVIRTVMDAPSRSPERLLERILGGTGYEEPKDLEYLKHVIDVMSPEDGVILDFYAGSGTTGHAILDLNYENINSRRKFLLVSHDEKGMYSRVLKPRLEAIISGRWADRQHRPRKATLKTAL